MIMIRPVKISFGPNLNGIAFLCNNFLVQHLKTIRYNQERTVANPIKTFTPQDKCTIEKSVFKQTF